MPLNAKSTIRRSGTRLIALAALACIALASCRGGPGGGHPDLVVESPTVSDDHPAAGAGFMFSATVRNGGDGNAAAATLRVFRSDDATITTDDEAVRRDTVAELAASASVVASVKLTAPSRTGTYYYGACVDAVAGESVTANNCSAAAQVNVREAQDTAPTSPFPDLVVEYPVVSPVTPAAGASFTFSATVRNAGGGDAPATTLHVYLSADETVTTADEEVGADAVGELAVSASGIESVELTAPSSTGTYFYGACVRAVTEESDSTNNCSASVPVTVPEPLPPGQALQPARRWAPDLAPEYVSVTSANREQPPAGMPITLSVTMRNYGNALSAATTMRLYHSTDATITTSDTEIHAEAVPPMVPWPWIYPRVNVSVTLPAPSTPGRHYYGGCVDALAGESNLTNNCSQARGITVPRVPPDLKVVSAYVVPGSPAVGGRFNVAASVLNAGGVPVWEPAVTYYRSEDATITTSDTSVGAHKLRFVPVGGNRDTKLALGTPSSHGTYYYGVCADTMEGELDTTNNCSQAVEIEVSHDKPNLLIHHLTWSRGTETVSLGPVVWNVGADFDETTWLRFYQSADATVTTSDTELAAEEVSLRCCWDAFDYFAGWQTVTLPSTPGTYYYGACVDVVSGESDTTDNCSRSVWSFTRREAQAAGEMELIPAVD